MSRCSEIVKYFKGISFLDQFSQGPNNKILHFWEAGSRCNWHPLAFSKSVTTLSIISNFFFLEIAGFTSSQYPMSLNFSSIGGILLFELLFWGPKLGFEISGIPGSLLLRYVSRGSIAYPNHKERGQFPCLMLIFYF